MAFLERIQGHGYGLFVTFGVILGTTRDVGEPLPEHAVVGWGCQETLSRVAAVSAKLIKKVEKLGLLRQMRDCEARPREGWRIGNTHLECSRVQRRSPFLEEGESTVWQLLTRLSTYVSLMEHP